MLSFFNFFLYNDFVFFLPEIFLCIYIIVLLVYKSYFENLKRKISPKLNIFFIYFSVYILFILLIMYFNMLNIDLLFFFNEFFFFTSFLVWLKIFFIFFLILFFFISSSYLKSEKIFEGEYQILIMFSIFGLLLLFNVNNFLSFFLCIEIYALSCYI